MTIDIISAGSLSSPPNPCWVHPLGTIPYPQAWALQKRLCQQLIEQPTAPDRLLLLEHPPVYTLGTGSSLDHVKFVPEQSAAELLRIERGGEVTYHCPGQIVGYPILNLRRYQTDLHWYLRQLETVLIQVIAKYGLKGERIPGLTGVWVDGYKVAAIGIKVKRWVTMHGFALNVCPDLSGFKQIVPCGISDRPVGSLEQFIPDLKIEQFYQDIPLIFADVFNCMMRLSVETHSEIDNIT